MPAPNHAAPQMKPFPIAARIRRPHVFMNSPVLNWRVFRAPIVGGKVLGEAKYRSGGRKSRAPCTARLVTRVGVSDEQRPARVAIGVRQIANGPRSHRYSLPVWLTFFRSAARGLHVAAELTREPTRREARKRRASERPRVGCCEELAGGQRLDARQQCLGRLVASNIGSTTLQEYLAFFV